MATNTLAYTCGHRLASLKGHTETDCPACRQMTTDEYVEGKTADLQRRLAEERRFDWGFLFQFMNVWEERRQLQAKLQQAEHRVEELEATNRGKVWPHSHLEITSFGGKCPNCGGLTEAQEGE